MEEIKKLKKINRNLRTSIEAFKEYRRAYYLLMANWEDFDSEKRKQINDELNAIFRLNYWEKVEDY